MANAADPVVRYSLPAPQPESRDVLWGGLTSRDHPCAEVGSVVREQE